MDLKFGDTVKIREGFFEGCEGIVAYYDKVNSLYLIEGYKLISDNYLRDFQTEEYEENLEKI